MGIGSLLRRKSQAPAPKADEQALFDEQFQRKLEYLAIVARRVFAGVNRAERRSHVVGSGIEFADHRDYVVGDDFRYLDWNVYQRLGRLLLRLYEEEEDLSIYLVLDTSSSMGFGAGNKLIYGKKLVAALAYIGLANLDRVSIVTTTDRLVDRMPSTRGKQRIFRVFEFLRAAQPRGNTDLGAAMKVFVSQHKRKGVVVVVSDLFDPVGFENGINTLRYDKFEPFVLHLTNAADATPNLHGDVRLYDCETLEEREVTVTPSVLEKYRRAYDNYLQQVLTFCTSKQVPYVQADTIIPFDQMVLRVLRRGGIVG